MWLSREAIEFIRTARHIYETEKMTIYGNGEIVLRVCWPECRKSRFHVTRYQWIGINGKNEWGKPFVYEHYFLPKVTT